MTNRYNKTSEKVAVPREVAEAIEEMRKGGRSNYNVMYLAAGAVVTPGPLTIRRWAFDGEGGTPDLLMLALVNGYEVEKTPEERLEEYRYNLGVLRRESLSEASTRQHELITSEIAGINHTLDILGIKIEGVNA